MKKSIELDQEKLKEADSDIHCMPNDGTHECSEKCWCCPELNADYTDEGGKRLWVHRELQ